jgi:hypothetical protein
VRGFRPPMHCKRVRVYFEALSHGAPSVPLRAHCGRALRFTPGVVVLLLCVRLRLSCANQVRARRLGARKSINTPNNMVLYR